MLKLKTVFNFELRGMLQKKSLLVTTGIMCVIVLLLTSIPTFIDLFGGEDIEEGTGENGGTAEELTLVYENDELSEAISPVLGEAAYQTEAELREAVQNEEVASGFVVEDYDRYTYISYDSSTDATDQMIFEAQLKQLNENRLFEENGMDSQRIREILNQPIEQETVFLGKDAGSGTAIAFAIMIIMYLLILLYGSSVATSVAREKDSRTMELLITSSNPRTLILGKVGAVGLTGILQVASLIVFGVIGFMLNKENYPEFLLDMLQGSMTMDVVLVYVLFSVLGYILYLFIYAALGSLVSKVEDVNSAVTPITFLFVLAYFAATIATNAPDIAIVKVTSYIPFISLFTMPIRYMLTSVPIASLLVSSAIMLITVVLFAWLSIHIYKFGALNYGNRLKFKDVIQSFRK
ncbi:ABC transporter permease [Planomicrobium okeanokoites]|uniref:ABC transporter permease n=1 Tax=Planomicrobium okeanokoites TaxID=244 RepID=UPI000A03B440|nr:ABC transporter permease [Planomicrobium okeanokoites]